MYKTYADVKAALDKGLSVRDILQSYFEAIEDRKDLNAFTEVFFDSALKKADEVDQKLSEGTAGKLAGMVIAIKDNICYKNHKVSASSKILEGFESIYSATVVERLLAEDAIIIGRTNCDEFAMGSSNENSAFGPVRNALNEDFVPGG
jgi:aspartyl-tRNA(Asn)/glutamyl-tRNA(Gln) amidotransferase subunit A